MAEGTSEDTAAPVTTPADNFDFFGDSSADKKEEKAPEEAKPAKKADSQAGPAQEATAKPEEADDEEEDDEDEGDLEEEDLEPEPGTKTQRRKPVVIKTARKELKMPPSAKVAVNVAGKEELVTLEEVTESYTSRAENKRRMNEITTYERQVKQSKESEQETLKGLVTKLSKPEDALTALGEIIELSGGEPLPVLKALRGTIVDSVAQMLGASPEQVRALKHQLASFEMIEEANYYKEKYTREQESKKKVAEREQVVQRVRQVIRDYGIPDEQTFVETFETLKQFKADNKLKQDDVTPSDVGGFYRMQGLIDAEFPALNDDIEAKVKLFRIAREMDPTKEELRKLMRQWLSSGGEVKAPEEEDADKPKLSSKPKTVKQSGTKPNKLADLFL